MPFDLGRTFQQAEDFLRRHIKPKAVSEAEKRRSRNRARSAALRIARAGGVAGASGAGLMGFSAAVAPLATPVLLAAGAATVLAAGAVLFWPARRAGERRISSEELMLLVLEAEDWLLDQRKTIVGRALPALDSIFFRLNDLHPHLERINPNGPLAWDLRRLLTQHLPVLIQTYGELPATVREADPTLLARLIGGFETLDAELVRLCREVSSDHLLAFETRGRFIEDRYKDSERLRSEEQAGDAPRD